MAKRTLKYYLLIVFALTISLTTFAMPSMAQSIPATPKVTIQTWQTTQKVPVYFIRASEVPMVDVRLVLAAGSAYDGKQWGLAELTANSLAEGSIHKTAQQLAERLEQVGAQFSGAIDRDKAVISLRTLSDEQYLTPAINTFTEIVGQADFPEKELNRIKQQTLAIIKQSQQNPGVVAEEAFYQTAFQNSPYAHPVMGTATSVSKLTREQVLQFYKRYYVQANAKIVIVGDVTKEQAQKVAENIAGSLKQGKAAAKLATVEPSPNVIKGINKDSKQSAIIIGQVGIDYSAKNYFPLIVANEILGGGGLDSILFEKIRNQNGLAYAPYSRLIRLQARGPFILSLKTRAPQSNQAVILTKAVLRDYLQNGPTEKQFQQAKENMVNGFPLRLATNANLSALLTQIAFYQLPLDYLNTYQQHINQVTLKQVKQTFSELVKPEHWVTIMVGPNQPNKPTHSLTEASQRICAR